MVNTTIGLSKVEELKLHCGVAVAVEDGGAMKKMSTEIAQDIMHKWSESRVLVSRFVDVDSLDPDSPQPKKSRTWA